jgi:hypothetical protein
VAEAVDRLIARLAGRYFGLVTHAQLVALGLGRGAIEHRVRTGRLIVVHPGVYAVGHRRTDPLAVAAAAVLAGGPGALLSHSSAAALWGMMPRWQAPLEIIVPADRRPAGIRAHRSRTVARRDIRRQLGIRVTRPARTLLDVTPRLNAIGLARAVNVSRHNRHLRLSDLAELLDRLPHHPGASRLRSFLDAPAGPTRSEFEDRFVEFARRFGLPAPEINVYVAGYLVDVLFAAERVIVELDGYEYHGDRSAFERDRERDAAALAAGHATVRVTWDRLAGAAEREAARLDGILRGRRA